MLRCCLFLALCLPLPALAAEWRVDPRTRVTVDVAWRGALVTVAFPDIEGDVTFDERRPERARAEIRVGTARATAGFGLVDALLRGEGYLDAARYPLIAFHLDQLVPTSRSTARIDGRISLRGLTRPAVFTAQVFRYGPAPDDPARFEAGFDVRGEIDRTQFGSTAGLPDVPAILPVHVRLILSSVP
jgi:polyisoprenoid-binding protein YceI